MFLLIWEYRVRPERLDEFLAVYGPEGLWAQFFRGSRGFLGTELLADETRARRFLSIDRWATAAAYEECRWSRGADYDALDRASAVLVEHEARLGTFSVIDWPASRVME